MIDQTNIKKERYVALLAQLRELLSDESNMIANMANMSAALYAEFKFHWVGFYLVEGEELVLGPFQGPVACTRIPKGKGVCGKAWEKRQTQIVANVEEFSGHIACSPHSKSEIVIPMKRNDNVIGVLDIDSDEYNFFSKEDELYLSAMLFLLYK